MYEVYQEDYSNRERAGRGQPGFDVRKLQAETVRSLKDESALAGMLLTFFQRDYYPELQSIFYAAKVDQATFELTLAGLAQNYEDPFLTFDPTKQVRDVTLSIGIVHLFRQYFFELDSFVETPVGHVWLSPGSTVELVEVSTRRSLVEKTIETALEQMTTILPNGPIAAIDGIRNRLTSPPRPRSPQLPPLTRTRQPRVPVGN